MCKRSQKATLKEKFSLELKKDYEKIEEQKKIRIWKKLIFKKVLIRYNSFFLVSNIHQRINIRGNSIYYPMLFEIFGEEAIFNKYLCVYQLVDAFEIKKARR
jgi:hypothetical protein